MISASAEVTRHTDKSIIELIVRVGRDDGVQALSGAAVCYTFTRAP